MTNLDYLCVNKGLEIGKVKDKNILQKSLGVLQEDGVYAMFLWLESKDKNANIRNEFVKLFNEELLEPYFADSFNSVNDDFSSFCNALTKVTKDIDKLLFMKKIIERTLTYAYYLARGKGEQKDENNVE